jgi:hypothetical protein
MRPITRVKQVLPEELQKSVKGVVDQVPWKYGWASNKSIEFTHWNYDFAGAGALNTIDVSHKLQGPIKDAWDHIQKTITGPSALLRCYTNSHTFGVEGYPHTDSRREADKTILIYMTPGWQRNWGGETVVYHGNEIAHSELPHYGSGLIFHGADWHCARSVTRICPAQRITLMFKYSPHDVDPIRNKLQEFLTALGTNKVKHSGRTLWTHLLNTYDILKANGFKQEICSAGGLHSIFGTNAFKKQTLTIEQRDIVVNVIGEEATKLVELFHTVKRPGTLEEALKNNTCTVTMNDGSLKDLSSNQLNSICAIEAANLADQKSLKNYPLLAKFLRNKE